MSIDEIVRRLRDLELKASPIPWRLNRCANDWTSITKEPWHDAEDDELMVEMRNWLPVLLEEIYHQREANALLIGVLRASKNSYAKATGDSFAEAAE